MYTHTHTHTHIYIYTYIYIYIYIFEINKSSAIEFIVIINILSSSLDISVTASRINNSKAYRTHMGNLWVYIHTGWSKRNVPYFGRWYYCLLWKKGLYEQMCNSAWLSSYSCLNLQVKININENEERWITYW